MISVFCRYIQIMQKYGFSFYDMNLEEMTKRQYRAHIQTKISLTESPLDSLESSKS